MSLDVQKPRETGTALSNLIAANSQVLAQNPTLFQAIPIINHLAGATGDTFTLDDGQQAQLLGLVGAFAQIPGIQNNTNFKTVATNTGADKFIQVTATALVIAGDAARGLAARASRFGQVTGFTDRPAPDSDTTEITDDMIVDSDDSQDKIAEHAKAALDALAKYETSRPEHRSRDSDHERLKRDQLEASRDFVQYAYALYDAIIDTNGRDYERYRHISIDAFFGSFSSVSSTIGTSNPALAQLKNVLIAANADRGTAAIDSGKLNSLGRTLDTVHTTIITTAGANTPQFLHANPQVHSELTTALFVRAIRNFNSYEDNSGLHKYILILLLQNALARIAMRYPELAQDPQKLAGTLYQILPTAANEERKDAILFDITAILIEECGGERAIKSQLPRREQNANLQGLFKTAIDLALTAHSKELTEENIFKARMAFAWVELQAIDKSNKTPEIKQREKAFLATEFLRAWAGVKGIPPLTLIEQIGRAHTGTAIAQDLQTRIDKYAPNAQINKMGSDVIGNQLDVIADLAKPVFEAEHAASRPATEARVTVVVQSGHGKVTVHRGSPPTLKAGQEAIEVSAKDQPKEDDHRAGFWNKLGLGRGKTTPHR